MTTPRPCYDFPCGRSCIGSNHLIMLQALPEDLKMKLSLDEDLVSSPKEALSSASADRVTMRNKHLKRCTFLIFSIGIQFITADMAFEQVSRQPKVVGSIYC